MATRRTTHSTPHCCVSLSVISALFLLPLWRSYLSTLVSSFSFFLPFLFSCVLPLPYYLFTFAFNVKWFELNFKLKNHVLMVLLLDFIFLLFCLLSIFRELLLILSKCSGHKKKNIYVFPFANNQCSHQQTKWKAHSKKYFQLIELFPLTALSAPVLDDSTVSQLCEMGFPLEACRKAVYYTGNTGIDAAMNWIMGHMDDPGVQNSGKLTRKKNTNVLLLRSFFSFSSVWLTADFSAPLVLPGCSSGPGTTPTESLSEEHLATIVSMGFSRDQATKALRATVRIKLRPVWIRDFTNLTFHLS